MPAINVARTDTFEQQRVKINQIGNQLFNITAGGSDLATGNLKIGDGSKSAPSLAFENEPTFGLYRPDNGVMAFVRSGKKILNIEADSFISYRDIALQKDVVSELLISSGGTNYDAGNYNNVPLFGGTGENLTVDIQVTAFTGTVTNDGEGYFSGSYQNVSLLGGSGSGATVAFDVEDIEFNILDAGTGYEPGTFQNVPITSITGSGINATANVIVTGSTIITGSITNPGSSYTENTYSNLQVFNVPANTYSLTVVSNPGTPPPNNVYQINGVTQQTLTLIRGNTYRFSVEDPSVLGHPLIFRATDGSILDPSYYSTAQSGVPGSSGAFIDFIIADDAPTGTIKYDCSVHPGMGANITITTGSSGNFGFGAQASAEVNASGNVISFSITNNGTNYASGDTVTLSQVDIGSGTGFVYTLGTFTYNGVVDTIAIQNQGSGYEQGDRLTINETNLGNVGGSGLDFQITNNPSSIVNLTFEDKGENYQVNDVLTLPASVTGVTGVLNGRVQDVPVTLSTASANVTVPNGNGIKAGMQVLADPTSTGQLSPATFVLSVAGNIVTLDQNPAADGAAVLTFRDLDPFDEIVVSSIAGISDGMIVSVASGVGTLPSGVTVSSIDADTNTITLSEDSTFPGNVVLTFSPEFGDPSIDFSFRIDNLGEIDIVAINDAGNGYEVLDQLTVDPVNLVQPVVFAVTNKILQKITFSSTLPAGSITTSDTVSMSDDGIMYYDVAYVKLVGGNISYILVDSSSLFAAGGSLIKDGSATLYPINSVDSTYRYLIDGNINPSITLYSGSTYTFDLSDQSNTSHIFALSAFPDGKYSTLNVEDVSGSVAYGSDVVSLTSSAGILVGMEVFVISGSGLPLINLFVEEIINGTDVRLSQASSISGAVVLSFRGTEYVDSVVRESDSLTITVRDDTPALYYYCDAAAQGHEDEGGFDGEEIQISTNVNNPKVFGSSALFVVSQISTTNPLFVDIETGKLDATEIETTTFVSDTVSSTSVSASEISASTYVQTPQIRYPNNVLNVNSSSVKLSGGLNINDKLTVASSSGDLLTSGIIRTSSYFNSNNVLRIENNTISTTTNTSDIILSPFTGRLVRIASSGALVIPVGNTSARPQALAQNGAIRFNTETGQYEGYNATNTAWSSLGGVRDLDGNTYIKAEETTGSNDNRLWFYNDGNNTLRVTPSYMEFMSMKKIRSLNTNAPAFTQWTSNTAVTVGQFLKYQHDIYEVIVGGITATPGNEPSNTTGNNFANGTATLRYFTTAVAFLTFEEIAEIRIGPNKSVPMLFEGDLRITKNTISTDITDITLKPNTGRRVICDAKTHIQIPAGTENEKSTGTAKNGSIRYNITNQVYEGFSESTGTWGSLGGVKDVDQNTYIIPETAPGANENILYFYNDNINTVQLTTTALDFTNINVLTCTFDNSLEVTASTVTFDRSSTTIDNTDIDSTFISTTKTNFDLGLSAGLTNDVVLRLNDQGDVYFNTGFGTGSQSLVRVFDSQLSNIEIAKYRISTNVTSLTKGTTNNGSAVIYSPATELSAKVEFLVYNTITGDKEIIEFSVIDKGSDILYTEIGTIQTSIPLITYTLDFNVNNAVRLNYSLASGVANGNVVNVTVVSNVIKK